MNVEIEIFVGSILNVGKILKEIKYLFILFPLYNMKYSAYFKLVSNDELLAK